MKTRVSRGTWMGRRGVDTTYFVSGGDLGLRVVEHRWDDEDTVSVRVVEGDAWRDPDGFREYLSVAGVEPGQGLALADNLC